jgi:hypothetical protein
MLDAQVRRMQNRLHQCICINVYMVEWCCRTSEAFKRRLGVLGVNEQAERMLKAFVSRGLELKLDEIKYHAQGKDNEIERLTGISGASSDSEVINV